MGIETALIGSALVGTAGSLLASNQSANAAKSAANAQAQSAADSIAAQERMFNKQVELQEPWRQAGITALNKLTPLSTSYTPFTADTMYNDPGYQFRLSEGMKALDRSAAARGGLMSGGALKAAQRYGQDYASNEYTNAFNRYQAERAAQLSPLQSLAGVGQTSAAQLSGAAGQLGSNLASTYAGLGQSQAQGILGAGQARASSYLGVPNTLSSSLGTYLNYTQNQNMMNALGNNGVQYIEIGQ